MLQENPTFLWGSQFQDFDENRYIQQHLAQMWFKITILGEIVQICSKPSEDIYKQTSVPQKYLMRPSHSDSYQSVIYCTNMEQQTEIFFFPQALSGLQLLSKRGGHGSEKYTLVDFWLMYDRR